MIVLSVLFAMLAWQLDWNRAVVDGHKISVRAGFYSQRWPLKVIYASWSEPPLNEFHR